MKWLNGLVSLALVLALGVMFTGCDDDDNDPLVGRWNLVSADGEGLPANVSVIVTFNKNGTGSTETRVGSNTKVDNFTWSKGEGALDVVNQDGSRESIPYTLAGRTLTIVMDGDTLVFERL